MRIPFPFRVAMLVALTASLAIALTLVSRTDTHAHETLAQLAATNYRTLTPKQSHALMQFARAEYRCLSAQGVEITAPVASRTQITMRAPGRSAIELAHAGLACAPAVGPPPPKSSLQARRGLVLVYLPKRCLMDPSELPQT